jgi:molybdate transport system ATP-binding protein
MKLLLENIVLPLPDFDLFADGSFDIGLMVLLGPSGAGKTSFLEILAGLRQPSQGRMALDDRILFDAARNFFIPPHRRRIGYVPQDLALFPHLSVRANLAYGCREGMRGQKFAAISEVLEIGSLLDRMPSTLSGGEKQRVAFARALLSEPQLLLLDEPLSSLDRPLKEKVIHLLHRMYAEFGIPMLYVTHSHWEARLLAGHFLKLERGNFVSGVMPMECLGITLELEVE